MKKQKFILVFLCAVLGCCLLLFAACGEQGEKDTAAPVITAENTTAVLDTAVDLSELVSATDDVDEAADLTFAYQVTFGGKALELSGTSFTPEQAGEYTVTVTVTDKAGNESSKTFKITVAPAADTTAPVIELNAAQVEAKTDETVNLSLNVKKITDDVDEVFMESQIKYSVAFGGETETLSSANYTPQSAGDYTVTVTATDSSGNAGTATFTLKVADNTPVIELESETVRLVYGQTADLTANVASVSDGEGGTIEVSELTFTAALGSDTQTVQTPAQFKPAAPGQYTVTVKAVNDAEKEGTAVFTLDVYDGTAPVIEMKLADSTKVTGEEWDYELTVGNIYYFRLYDHLVAGVQDDVDGEITLTADNYTVTDGAGQPVSPIRVTSGDATLFNAVNVEAGKTYFIAVTASDEAGNEGSVTVKVNVQDTNAASFDLMDKAPNAEYEVWFHNTDSKCTGAYSQDTRNGFGFSFALTALQSDARVKLVSNKISGVKFDSLALWVKISSSQQLTADQLKELTPKPEGAEGTDWTCRSGYPAKANEWTQVIYTFAQVQTSAIVIGGGNGLVFADTRENKPETDDLAVLIDDLSYGHFAVGLASGAVVWEEDPGELNAKTDLGIALPTYTASVDYTLTDVKTQKEVQIADFTSFTLPDFGRYTLKIEVTDIYGRQTEGTLTLVMLDGPDEEAPVIDMKLNDDLKVSGQDWDYELTVGDTYRFRLYDYLVESVTDNVDGAIVLSESAYAVKDETGAPVSILTGANNYKYFEAKAGKTYFVEISASDFLGNVSTVRVKVNVDGINAASFDIIDVADGATEEVWRNSGASYYTGAWSEDTRNGFGHSYKATALQAGSTVAFFNTIINNRQFNKISLWVKISTAETLTQTQLQELTPKPKLPSGVSFECTSGYPAQTNVWTKVEFTFSAQTQATWVGGAGMDFTDTTGAADLAVYFDDITYYMV